MPAKQIAVWIALGLVAWVWTAKRVVAEGPPAGPTQTLIVDATAPVIGGDVTAARQVAIQQAMREAVQRTAGVHVRASLRVRNYAVLEDRITTRAEGLAVIEEILSEQREGDTYRVRARVAVRVRPLLRELASAADPPRRVLVLLGSSTYYGYLPTAAVDAVAAFSQCLTEAGIEVIPWGRQAGAAEEALRLSSAGPEEVAAWGRGKGAGIVVAGRLTTRVEPGISLPKEWVGIPYSRCFAEIRARAIQCDTGTALAEERSAGDCDGVSPGDAIRAGTRQAALRSGRRMAEALAGVPGVASHRLSLSLAGFTRVSEAARFEDAVATLPGIRRVTRKAFVDGTLSLEVALPTEAAHELPALLEESLFLEEFSVTIERASGDAVTGRVHPTPPEE